MQYKRIGFYILTVCLAAGLVTGCFDRRPSVKKGSTVTFKYSLEADGLQIVGPQKPEELTINVGDYDLPPTLEESMIGLKEGSVKAVILRPDQGYGDYDKSLLAKISKSALPEGLKLEEGMIITGGLGGKKSTPGMRVLKVLDDAVVIDKNHPLAGKRLTYRIRIEKIKE